LWIAPRVADLIARECGIKYHPGHVWKLLRHLCGNILVTWDRLSARCSRLVGDFVAQQNGRLQLEFVAAYAPELNSAEYIWGHLKTHQLAGFCARDLSHLSVYPIRPSNLCVAAPP
jgi:transposase